MTIEEQITQSAFLKSTIQKVKSLYQSNESKSSVDAYNMNFRLSKQFNGDTKNINYELLCKDPYGYYFKTIGQYVVFDGRQLGLGVNLIFRLVREFSSSYRKIHQEHKLEDTSIKAGKYSNEENALIGALSREAYVLAQHLSNSDKRSISFSENGMDYNIEKAANNHAITIYVIGTEGKKYIVAQYSNIDTGMQMEILNFKEQAEKLAEQSLLTVLKRDFIR